MSNVKCPSCGARLQIRVQTSAPLVTVVCEPEQRALDVPLIDRMRAALAARGSRGASVRELQRGALQGEKAEALTDASERLIDAGEVETLVDVPGRGRLVFRLRPTE